MQTQCFEHPNRRKIAAFITRTELFVILGVIAVLAVLILVATSSGGGAQRAQCLANIKQFTAGMILYGNQNQGRLPRLAGGLWAWDLPNRTSDALQHNGVTRDMMYDPGNPEQNNDALWNWPEGFRVIGYAMTFPGTASVTPINQNPTFTLQPIRTAVSVAPSTDPSQRVLIAGAVVSLPGQGDVNQRNSYQFSALPGAWAGGTHRSSHLDSTGKMPIGDNLGMLDGSGTWRKFEEMTPRTNPGGTSPVFWW